MKILFMLTQVTWQKFPILKDGQGQGRKLSMQKSKDLNFSPLISVMELKIIKNNFYAVCVICQYQLENGSALFDI